MKWEHDITSDLHELKGWNATGKRVTVGFRPSGSLHVGNLLTITYAAAVADRLAKPLELAICDTDWSAHLHEHHFPDNNRVMKLFFKRECPCGEHENVAEHRLEEIRPFLEAVEKQLGVEIDTKYLTELQGDKEYTDALRKILRNMPEFDDIFGGGFMRRYISPVTVVCDECGYSHAKGASHSPGTDELVAPCRNMECMNGFMSEPLTGEIGVYYLVDPVRDPSRDVAVHVFGGDYRVAQKEQKTSKIAKVAKITEMATGETPAYFLAPMISDENGRPLSKSKNTGKTVEDIEDLEEFGAELASKVTVWLEDEKKHIRQDNL